MVKFMLLLIVLFVAFGLLAMTALLTATEPEPDAPAADALPEAPVVATPTADALLEAPVVATPTLPPLLLPTPTEVAPGAVPRTSPFTLELRVGDEQLNVRVAPRRSAARVTRLNPGAHFRSDPTSALQADGFIWHFHDAGGWSAIGPIDGGWASAFVDQVSVTQKRDLPFYGELFVSAPVDLGRVDWIQYFGDTAFARRFGNRLNYDGYAQGLHGGLDFGVDRSTASFGVPVFASLYGTVSSATANQVWVESGPYSVGYVHVEDTPMSIEIGSEVQPDTFLGNISRTDHAATNLHLHLEVIYGGRYLVNPAELMPALPWDEFVSEGFAPGATHLDPSAQPLIELSVNRE